MPLEAAEPPFSRNAQRVGLEDPHVPKLGIRVRGTDRPETELRRRPSRPPSRSRTRTGGAAGAVLLIVLGTGTLGALPVVHVDVGGT